MSRLGDFDPSSSSLSSNGYRAEPGGPLPGTAAPQLSRIDYTRMLYRGRWWLLSLTVLGTVLGLVLVSQQKPVYEARSRMLIQQRSLVDQVRAVDGPTPAEQQAKVLVSESMLDLALNRPELRAVDYVAKSENPMAALKEGLRVIVEKDLITLTFRSPNVLDNGVIVNNLVDTYDAATRAKSGNLANRDITTLENERNRLTEDLRVAVQAVTDKRKANGILSFAGDRSNIIYETLAKLSAELTNAEMALITARSDYDWMTSLRDKNDRGALLELAKLRVRANMPTAMEVQASDGGRRIVRTTDVDPLAALEQAEQINEQQISEAQLKLDLMRATRRPDHPEVVAAQLELDMLQNRLAERLAKAQERYNRREQKMDESDKAALDRMAQLQTKQEDQLIAAYVAEVERVFRQAERYRADVKAAFDAQRDQAYDLNKVAADYQQVEGEQKRIEALIARLDDRIKEIPISQNTNAVSVDVIERAKPTPADSPVAPKWYQWILAGMLGGMAGGFGIAALLEVSDQRLRSAEEIADVLETPMLGLVPHMNGNPPPSVRGRMLFNAPTSDVAESFRSLRTSLLFNIRGSECKTLLVTSPTPGDGKSTTASNLASALAQSGRKVLLIDGDCRKPTQHKIFDVENGAGLSDVIQHGMPVGEAIVNVAERLDLLRCGPVPQNPVEILNGQAFSDMLDGLKQKYDYVVIDSPPVVPVADARIYATLCDATLLVLRAEKATRRMARYAAEALGQSGARLVGVVVNDVPRRKDRYGYYYGYGYGYRYYQYGYGPDRSTKTGGRNGSANGNGSAHGNGRRGSGAMVKSDAE
jgi:capsular exopolysaccharide synthesis family protein